MSESPRWVQLVKTALRKNSSPTNKYIQVATVRRDGRPACRTVVYRGFRDEQSMVPKLTFTTDSRSEKVGQVQHQSWAEICWYFADSREQFRLLGEMQVIGEDEKDEKLQKARVGRWKGMSDSGREQFSCPCPGQPKNAENGSPCEEGSVEKDVPLSSFCLVLFKPQNVDYLNLKKPQKRLIFRFQETSWNEQEVNP